MCVRVFEYVRVMHVRARAVQRSRIGPFGSVCSDGDLSCSDRPVLFVGLARVLAVHDEGVLRVIRACVETDGIRV